VRSAQHEQWDIGYAPAATSTAFALLQGSMSASSSYLHHAKASPAQLYRLQRPNTHAHSESLGRQVLLVRVRDTIIRTVMLQDIFYDKIMADDRLNYFFEGVDMKAQRVHQVGPPMRSTVVVNSSPPVPSHLRHLTPMLPIHCT